jgi:hypothetical protein
MSFVIAACLGMAVSSAASSQTLWQNTKVGMSPEEVKTLYPAALGPKVPYGGESMSENDVSIFGQLFDVLFQFQDHKLRQVSVSSGSGYASSLLGQHLDNPAVEYLEISEELTKKYGAPVYTHDSNAFKMLTKEDDFLSNGVSIRLTYMDTTALTANGDIFVSITYEPANGGNAPL